jgi:hypothetical protein
MSTIGSVRPTTPVRTARPAQAPASNAAPAQAPKPKAPAVARGPVDTGAKVGGSVAGLLAGAGGAASIALLFLAGGTMVTPAGWAVMAGVTALGGGLGYLGGDRIGDMLEGKKATGKPHTVSQVVGGAAGGVLGLAGGFWLGGIALGRFFGGPAIGLVTGVAAAALGALGGAEGAKRLAAKITGS